MKFHKQKRPDHDPKKGVWGDCYRTVVACLLDYELEEVPNFADPAVHKTYESGTFRGAIDEWLAAHGFRCIRVVFPQGDGHREHSPEEMRQHFASTRIGKDGYWLFVGESGYGTNHVVICHGSEIIHDPSDTGIVGPAKVGNRFAYYAHRIMPRPRGSTRT